MPEGPEIHLSADRLHAALAGKPAETVRFAFEHLKTYEDELSGREMTAVEARGKAILTRFEGGRVVYSHNQLYGRWWIVERGKPPETGRQLRLEIHTAKRSALLYSASDIEVLAADDLWEHPYLARLGPDVLDEELTPQAIAERAGSKTFAGRGFAALLLDQGFAAGMGNYLRSEVLFDAGLHPRRRPADCSQEELARLGESLVKLPRRSYETRGLTNDPERVQQLKAEGVRRSRYRFAVFGRDGRPCYECGTPIERHELTSRRCYLCPVCQPA